jgi:hypothetical protein
MTTAIGTNQKLVIKRVLVRMKSSTLSTVPGIVTREIWLVKGYISKPSDNGELETWTT